GIQCVSEREILSLLCGKTLRDLLRSRFHQWSGSFHRQGLTRGPDFHLQRSQRGVSAHIHDHPLRFISPEIGGFNLDVVCPGWQTPQREISTCCRNCVELAVSRKVLCCILGSADDFDMRVFYCICV